MSCPDLPGCWSQGKTKEEALENIQCAIREYLEAVEKLAERQKGREAEISVLIVPKIPGVNHLRAVRALEKAGFRVVHEEKQVVMSDGTRILTIPRHNPINAHTMGGIARDAGLTPAQFRKLL